MYGTYINVLLFSDKNDFDIFYIFYFRICK